MGMYRCSGGGKAKEATINVTGVSFYESQYGGNRKGAQGRVALPNLGWTKAVCTSATSTNVPGTPGTKINNIAVSIGSEKDISSLETITLQVTSNATANNNSLYGGDQVSATFILK